MPPEIEAQAPPQTIPVIPQDPASPIPPQPLSPDDDPNLKMQRIASRRRTEKPAEGEKPAEKPAEAKPSDIKKLGGEISKALGFRQDKPKEEKDEKGNLEAGLDGREAEKGNKEAEADGSKVESDSEKSSAAKKTIVKPKKAPAPAADPVKIAAAAATAAVKAAMPESRPAPAASSKPEDSLKSDDLHEYEVAKYLSEANPKYKDAPKLVLDHIRKSEAYAAQWEKENKGKVFNPNDDEHDEFFSALEKPWQDHEFRTAEMEMAAERVAERKTKGSDQKFKELEEENAKLALSPVVERTFTAAASVLAKKIGEDVHDKIVKGSFDKFAEEDPVTADAMAEAIGPLQPIIEAAIQLDDPKMRIKFNPKNQAHLDWNRLLLQKESELAGADDGSGRTMVSRAEFAGMTDAQRSGHWYLTAGQLIEELVGDAAESAKKVIEKENARLAKAAERMGYTKQSASPAPKKEQPKKPEEVSEKPVKPASPSAAGTSRIDDKGVANPSGSSKLLQTTAGILFNR